MAFLQTNSQQKKAFLISFIRLSTIANSLIGRGVCQIAGWATRLRWEFNYYLGNSQNCASKTAIPLRYPIFELQFKERKSALRIA